MDYLKNYLLNKKYSILTIVVIFAVIGIYLTLSSPGMKNKTGNRYEMEIIKLPEPFQDSKTSVEKALSERRSVREYKNEPLELAEISQLLWAAQGITDRRGFRTAPSAGALYPLELYIVAGNVNHLPNGIYKYNPNGHELSRVAEGDKRTELCDAALGQLSVSDAAAIIVFSAVYDRITGKYGNRGIRYTYTEVGHAAQNICLEAVSLNLGTVTI